MSNRKPGPKNRPPAPASRDGSAAARSSAPQSAAQRRLAERHAAAALQREADARRRRQLVAVGSSVVAVLLVVAVLIIVKVATGAGSPRSGRTASAIPATQLAQITGVPAATLDTVGAGAAKTLPVKISAPALTSGGKPEVLYIGAEYCPYCAAERWAMAVALSRFGTLHGLGETASSPSDVYPSTATLSFHGATYTSSLLTFVPREIQSNRVVNGSYATLDKLTSQQQAIDQKYNAPPYLSSTGSIPFVDMGGRYLISGASYDPGVLQGKTHAQIAAALADPNSPIAQAIDGTANLITAALCASTDGKPTAVCSSTGVQTAAAKLPK